MKTLDPQEFEQQNVFGLGAANDAYIRNICFSRSWGSVSPSSLTIFIILKARRMLFKIFSGRTNFIST